MGTKLLMYTSFHPQMDEAMERANRSIGQNFLGPNQTISKELGRKEPIDQVCNQFKYRKHNGIQVHAWNDEGDENDGNNTTRCKSVCLKYPKEHDTST